MLVSAIGTILFFRHSIVCKDDLARIWVRDTYLWPSLLGKQYPRINSLHVFPWWAKALLLLCEAYLDISLMSRCQGYASSRRCDFKDRVSDVWSGDTVTLSTQALTMDLVDRDWYSKSWLWTNELCNWLLTPSWPLWRSSLMVYVQLALARAFHSCRIWCFPEESSSINLIWTHAINRIHFDLTSHSKTRS